MGPLCGASYRWLIGKQSTTPVNFILYFLQTDQIVAEYKARVLECHPDKHPGDDNAGKYLSHFMRKDVFVAYADSKDPDQLAKECRSGTCSHYILQYLQSFYKQTVKALIRLPSAH